MSVSSRQRMILDILLQEHHDITVAQIAEQIEVSARTVYRELTVIGGLLSKYGLELVKKSGIGVQIEGDPEKKEELRLSLFNLTTTEYSSEERKVMILCTLIEAAEPIKLITLAYDLKVTTATISYDLDDLEGWLEKYGLYLIRRRGYGIEIQGTESAKRRVMSSLISENLNDHQLIGIIKENIQNKSLRHVDSISERLLGLIEKEKLIRVESALKNLDKELSYPIADSAYIGLVIHLALAVERIEKGENISFDENTLNELKETKEYKIAERIIERLNHIFELDIPAAEIGYIAMHLRGAKLRISQEDALWSDNVELMTKIQKFIQLCEARLNIPLREDPSLLHGLVTHMEPALFRMQRGMKIRNPLLDQIRKDYSELFLIIKEVAPMVFSDLDVPDEEIGYLMMHIGSAIERVNQVHQRYRALIVCSSGIGSSKILANRIQKEIPEIEKLQNLSLFDVGSIPKSDYDVIISTITLPMEPKDYVLVSPLLSPDDIREIKYFLRGINKTGHLHRYDTSTGIVGDPVDKIRSLQRYVNHSLEILEGFHYKKIDTSGLDIKGILTKVLNTLQNTVIGDRQEVVYKLLEREKLGGLSIPGTDLALFHCRSEEVLQTSFRIYSLSKPIFIRSMDDQEIKIRNLLLLLGPINISKEGLEVLSEISSLLIEEETVNILGTDDERLISVYFAEKLHDFCQKNRIG